MARDHRKLDAFQLADRFLLTVYRVTRGFPREELFVLTSQVRRAALSVPSNIVEGCGCAHEGQYVEHLNRARGSLREAGYQLDVAHRLGYVSEADWSAVWEEYDHAARVLERLIQSLK